MPARFAGAPATGPPLGVPPRASGAGPARGQCPLALLRRARLHAVWCGTPPPLLCPALQPPARQPARSNTPRLQPPWRASRARRECLAPLLRWRPSAANSTLTSRRRAARRRPVGTARMGRRQTCRRVRPARPAPKPPRPASRCLRVVPGGHVPLGMPRVPPPPPPLLVVPAGARLVGPALAGWTLDRSRQPDSQQLCQLGDGLDTVKVPTLSQQAERSHTDQGSANEHNSARGKAQSSSHLTHGAPGITSCHAPGLSAGSSKMIDAKTAR
eukprot:6058204-Pleurochrysis_carterae.AAC.2